jgi:hypothetical protein
MKLLHGCQLLYILRRYYYFRLYSEGMSDESKDLEGSGRGLAWQLPEGSEKTHAGPQPV